MKKIPVLIGCAFSVLCMELYSLWPYSDNMIKPFPFHSQELAKQVYIDYAATRAGICVMFFLLWRAFRWQELFVLFLLMVGYLIDYLLIYNNRFGTIYLGVEIPLSYTLFMVLSVVIIISRAIWKSV